MAIKKDNARIQVVIPKNLHEKLKKDADFECRSVSNIAAKIIKEYYKYNDNADEDC